MSVSTWTKKKWIFHYSRKDIEKSIAKLNKINKEKFAWMQRQKEK